MRHSGHIQSILSAIFILSLLLPHPGFPVHAQSSSGIPFPQQIVFSGPLGTSVNTYSGQLTYVVPLIQRVSRNLPFDLSFIYSSSGWSLSYDTHYFFVENGIVLQWGTGQRELFTPQEEGYSSAPGVTDRLEQYEFNRYRLLQADGIVLYFDSPAHQHITRIVDPNEQQITFQYAGNHLASITDAVGRTIEFSYTDTLLTQITDTISSRTIQLQYDENARLVSSTDVDGSQYQFAYTEGLLTQITDPNGSLISIQYLNGAVRSLQTPITNIAFAFNPGAGVTTIRQQVDGLERFYRYAYDSYGRIIGITDAFEHAHFFEWNENSQLVAVQDSEGNRTTYTYDGRGNVTSVTDQEGNTTSYSYTDPFNRIERVEAANGGVTTYRYDERGNLVEIVDPLGGTTQLTHDTNGDLLSITDALQQQTVFSYDEYGNLSTITSPSGRQTGSQFDAAGNLLALTDALGDTYTYTLDALGRVTGITDPLGNETRFQLDTLGNHTRLDNPLGASTTYSYDEHSQLTRIVEADGSTTEYRYNSAGDLIALLDAEGHETRFSYDAIGQLVAETDALGQMTSYRYDNRGNVAGKIDPDGATTHYSYNTRNLLTGIEYPDGSTVSYEYDALGRRTAMTDATGTTHYTYDLAGDLTDVEDALGNSLHYDYDALGRLTGLTYPDGQVVEYVYDVDNQLVEIHDAAGTILQSFDAAGRLTARAFPNGVQTNYRYNAANALISISHLDPQGKLLLGFEYGLNDLYQRIKTVRTSSSGTASSTYSYDLLGQLVTAVDADGNSTTYTYDKVGNRLSQTTAKGQITYQYNEANELIAAISPSHSIEYDYDVRGNLTTRTDGDDITHYSYTPTNLLAALEHGDQTISFLYNGDGQRIAKTVGDQITHYVYDSQSTLPQVLSEQTEQETTRYLTRVTPLAAESTGQTSYYLEDGLGSIVGITDQTGTLTQDFQYGFFGEPSSEAAVGYSGELYDAEAGLNYLRARYYDPQSGRFISRDPVYSEIFQPLSLNKYAYVLNDPLNYVDHFGFDGTPTRSEATWKAAGDLGWGVLGFTAGLAGIAAAPTNFGVSGAVGALALIQSSIAIGNAINQIYDLNKGVDPQVVARKYNLQGIASLVENAKTGRTISQGVGNRIDQAINLGTAFYGMSRSMANMLQWNNSRPSLFIPKMSYELPLNPLRPLTRAHMVPRPEYANDLIEFGSSALDFGRTRDDIIAPPPSPTKPGAAQEQFTNADPVPVQSAETNATNPTESGQPGAADSGPVSPTVGITIQCPTGATAVAFTSTRRVDEGDILQGCNYGPSESCQGDDPLYKGTVYVWSLEHGDECVHPEDFVHALPVPPADQSNAQEDPVISQNVPNVEVSLKCPEGSTTVFFTSARRVDEGDILQGCNYGPSELCQGDTPPYLGTVLVQSLAHGEECVHPDTFVDYSPTASTNEASGLEEPQPEEPPQDGYVCATTGDAGDLVVIPASEAANLPAGTRIVNSEGCSNLIDQVQGTPPTIVDTAPYGQGYWKGAVQIFTFDPDHDSSYARVEYVSSNGNWYGDTVFTVPADANGHALITIECACDASSCGTWYPVLNVTMVDAAGNESSPVQVTAICPMP